MTRVTILVALLAVQSLSAAAQPPAAGARPLPGAPVTDPPSLSAQETAELRGAFTLAIDAGRFDAALEVATTWARRTAAADVLDEVSYRLLDAGAGKEATLLLLRTYPFGGRPMRERQTLVERLSVLLPDHRGVVSQAQLDSLRTPLDTAYLRSQQARLWSALGDCGAVVTVLADRSSDYRVDDWLRLGDCSTPGNRQVAREAYAQAHQLQPGGRGSRGLAYEAYALDDYTASLAAWQATEAAALTPEDLLAAITSALAARDGQQAGSWLATYVERGLPESARYWSLAGQQVAAADPTAAIAALERAVSVRADIDDYLRLARLSPAGPRRVEWLERAATLDPANGDVELQLAYAYQHAGRPVAALGALERAAVLMPDDGRLQAELGFAYWRDGQAAPARQALERAWLADPDNRVLMMQLVYANQRLGRNPEARRYAERVLDAPAAVDSLMSATGRADQRFGLQRLHEDLGRRLTLSADGWSGRRVSAGTAATPVGGAFSSYAQLEADVRLGRAPIRNGRSVSAYARVIGDGGYGDDSQGLPSENTMLGLGVRWKPLGSQVLYLAVENQTGLDDRTRQDVMLRASASFLNAGRFSDDWHPGRSGWVARNLYLDAAEYLRSDTTAAAADYRMSYHKALFSSTTLEPYGHLQGSVIRTTGVDRDVRAGAGLRWNVWFGGSRYDAPPHKLSIGVEYQQAFVTYLTERRGLFLAINSRW